MSVVNNYVELEGRLQYPKKTVVGDGFSKFQAKLAIVTEHEFEDGTSKTYTNYLKIVAWGPVADSMAELAEGAVVRVQGSLSERSYDGTCKQCGAPEKKYWTDVRVNSFVEV